MKGFRDFILSRVTDLALIHPRFSWQDLFEFKGVSFMNICNVEEPEIYQRSSRGKKIILQTHRKYVKNIRRCFYGFKRFSEESKLLTDSQQ